MGFIGGVALQNIRRSVEANHSTARTDKVDGLGRGFLEDGALRQLSGNEDDIAAVARENHRQKPAPEPSLDLHTSNVTYKTRRAPERKLPQDVPAALSGIPALSSNEAGRGKKGLPFLKNPMSTLLMRRRNNQNAPALHPLPLHKKEDAPLYDPRIRGTRVHDFSAPRKSRDVYAQNPSITQSSSDVQLSASQDPHLPTRTASCEEPPRTQETPLDLPAAVRADKAAGTSRSSSQRKNVSSSSSRSKPDASGGNYGLDAAPQRSGIWDSSSLPRPAPKIDDPDSSDSAPRASGGNSTRSRNISLTDVTLSTIPRHMKSTSSRFSFDMVGAANQEKLLEERHRQRELDRKPAEDGGFRDSRFDDFDVDGFDYEAMMDDDGLEERIPGVNADFEEEVPEISVGYEGDCDPNREVAFAAHGVRERAPYTDDEELDPENDQENFAGFVFQRSNPASSLTSPHSIGMLATPRDADGNVIGFALTKDTPGSSSFPQSPFGHSLKPGLRQVSGASGLGIEGVNSPPLDSQCETSNYDDLYYDDGMVGYEDQFPEGLAPALDISDQPFDESIFDDNDTDEFGRPVPGAFQRAQSIRRAAQEITAKRESDLTSHLSVQSVTSRSTAHTSISADKQAVTEGSQIDAKGKRTNVRDEDRPGLGSGKSMIEYQAALAAAAHEAAASGKFQRAPSPSPVSAKKDDADSEKNQDDALDGYEDADDDFDIDDDAIIAEANASALANDSDGWYGQEFGFYSAPPNSYSTSHASGQSDVKEYAYANGGFFGPEGIARLDRSTSGRMTSREPNLTPITERSEYSNRNSLMSMGFPPLSSSTPAVQSPGLAQLAMMADSGDEQMTLSALLRLRSRAWGGSQASVPSSRDGSPRSERGDMSGLSWPVISRGGTGPAGANHVGKPSFSSNVSFEIDSDGESAPGSPTVTMAATATALDTRQNAVKPEEDSAQFAAVYGVAGRLSPDKDIEKGMRGGQPCETDGLAKPDPTKTGSSEVRCSGERSALNSVKSSSAKGHRHKGSAESVSYVREDDSGETRWVLERRRTADSGEVEVLEREFIMGQI